MNRSRHIRVRGIRRRTVDASKLGRALIELAQAQAEKEAQVEHKARQKGGTPPSSKRHQQKPNQDQVAS